MKRTIITLCGLALAMAATNVWAQDSAPSQQPQGPGRGPGPGLHRFPPPIMVMVDADKDGALSAEEIGQVSAKLLALDTNQDNTVTMEEIHAACPGQGAEGTRPPGPPPGMGKGKRGPGPGGHPPMFLGLFDADRDGTLSKAEIDNAPIVLSGLDKDQDGKVTPEELRPRDGRGPRGPRAWRGPEEGQPQQ